MTKQERIEALKKNERIFIRLEKEDFEIIDDMGCDNLLQYLLNNNKWHWGPVSLGPLVNREVYRIKNDYLPQGKTVAYPVTTSVDGDLCFTMHGLLYDLLSACNRPSFMRYKYKDGQETSSSRLVVMGKIAQIPEFVVFSND